MQGRVPFPEIATEDIPPNTSWEGLHRTAPVHPGISKLLHLSSRHGGTLSMIECGSSLICADELRSEY
jgi:hypothetical protein